MADPRQPDPIEGFAKAQSEPLPAEPYKRSVGRPAIEFDERDREIVMRMASRMCTNAEISEVLGCSDTTLTVNFRDELKLARAAAKESLRASQFRRAHQGSDPMLKWLGTQHLGQADKLITENTNQDIRINLVRGKDDEGDVPADE